MEQQDLSHAYSCEITVTQAAWLTFKTVHYVCLAKHMENITPLSTPLFFSNHAHSVHHNNDEKLANFQAVGCGPET